jgi:hypothetical protein
MADWIPAEAGMTFDIHQTTGPAAEEYLFIVIARSVATRQSHRSSGMV